MSNLQSGVTQQFADGVAASPSVQIGRPDAGLYLLRDGNGVPAGVGVTPMLIETSQDNLTAFATGGQPNATKITAQTARVATVAASGDSVSLPASVAGLELLVINHGVFPMQVYGAGTDTIDDVATATGVSQMQNSMVIYTCATAGKWYSQGLAEGYAGSFMTQSTKDAITAHAGNTQAGATLLTSMINRVVTVATTLDAVLLPVSVQGLQLVVVNAHASNSVSLYPNTGDAINAIAANSPFTIAPGKTVTAFCTAAGQWHTLLSA